VADAGTTPYQACKRPAFSPETMSLSSGLQAGWRIHGSDSQRLWCEGDHRDCQKPAEAAKALKYGADYVISSQDKAVKDIRNEFREICKKNGLEAGYGWKIFEVSGTKAGQDLALELLSLPGN